MSAFKYVDLEFTEFEYEQIVNAMRSDPSFEVSDVHLDYCVEGYCERIIIQYINQKNND